MNNEKYLKVKEKLAKQADVILNKVRSIKHNGREVSNHEMSVLLSRYSLSGIGEMREDQVEKLNDLLSRLDEMEMDIIDMRFWCGNSFKEIGERFGFTDEWARKKLKKAYEKMRK